MEDIKILEYYAKETIMLRKKLKENIFFNKENKKYIDELFNDSKIEEENVKIKSQKLEKIIRRLFYNQLFLHVQHADIMLIKFRYHTFCL